jgi:hypothetical protein
LDVSMDDLLGHAEPAVRPPLRTPSDHAAPASPGRESLDWLPAEGGPLSLPSSSAHPSVRSHFALDDVKSDDSRFAVDSQRRAPAVSFEGLLMREGELMSKLHDLLHSPLGPGIARIIEELHLMIPKGRNSS